MGRLRLIALALALSLWGLPVAWGEESPNLTVQKKMEIVELQNRLPLLVLKAIWVDRIEGYGFYEERARGNRFSPGDRGLLYIEPLNFAQVKEQDGRYRVSLSVSARVKDKKGVVLSESSSSGDVETKELRVRNPILDLYVGLNVDFSNWPPGEYVLEVTLRDKIKNQVSSYEVPVEVVEKKS